MGANVSRRRRWADGRGGLTRRAVVASALLLILIGGAFAFLVLAIMGLRQAVDLANHSRHVLATANYLERLVIDLETGQRGFIIAGDARFLQPWTQARAAIPVQSATLERLAAARSAEQGKRARQIERSIEAYMRDYSVPTVEAARRDPASVRTVEVTQEGKRRVDAIRTQFQRFVAYEDQLLALRQGRAAEAVTHATVAAAAGVAGSTLLVLAFDGYVIRSIVRPVRRASIMAGNLAAGDLSVRMLRPSRARSARSNSRSTPWRAISKRAATSFGESRRNRRRCGASPRSSPAQSRRPWYSSRSPPRWAASWKRIARR
jgi:CHASE3 domain sensor protein